MHGALANIAPKITDNLPDYFGQGPVVLRKSTTSQYEAIARMTASAAHKEVSPQHWKMRNTDTNH
eukprot:9709964-Prorocentrum_lima.AAC.1